MDLSFPYFDVVRGWVQALFSFLKWLVKAAKGVNLSTISVKLLGRVGDTWQIEVRNVGWGDAVPKAFLEKITDDKGRPTEKVTSRVEIYRLDSLEPIVLSSKNARAVYGILSIDWRHPAGPYPRLDAVITEREGEKVVKKKGEMLLNEPGLLEQQHQIRLEIRVVFYPPGNEQELTDAMIVYSVTPATGGYDVRPIRPPHMTLYDAQRLGIVSRAEE